MEAGTRFPPRYIIHQYWARKPWAVVRGLIEEFCPEGGTVIDPFMGSAVTCVESLSQNRNFVGVDINPVSLLMAKFYSNSPSQEKLEKAFDEVLSSVVSSEAELYSTTCPNCEENVHIINSIWKNNQPKSMYLNCHRCEFRGNKKYTIQDKKWLKSISPKLNENWFPNGVQMPPQSDVDKYEMLFSVRNRIALSLLFAKINQHNDGPEKDALLLAFTSLLPRMSRMVFINEYRRSRGANPAGVWGEKRYWVPDEHIENNVYYYFRERKTKFIEAIKDLNSVRKENNLANSIVALGTATNLSEVADESVDFCFTDPPYGDAVRYLDLSTIWNAWLSPKGVNKELEVIPKSKDLKEYSKLLMLSIREIHRVLKENAFFALAFQSTKPAIWKILLDSISLSGFKLIDLSSVRPSKKSHNQLDMSGSAKNDIILLLQKTESMPQNDTRPINTSFEDTVLSVARDECVSSPISPYKIYENLVLKFSKAYLQSNKNAEYPLVSIPKINKILSKSRDFCTVEIEEYDYKGEIRTTIAWSLSGLIDDNS